MKRYVKWMRAALLGLFLSLSLQVWFSVHAQSPAALDRGDVWLQIGKQHYEAGEFTKALQLWQKAAENASSDNKLQQTQALSLMSLAYQKLGQWEEAQKAMDLSWSLLKTVNPQDSSRIRAQVGNVQGLLQLAIGKAEEALVTWEKAEEAYRQAGVQEGVTGSQLNRAKALEALGFYRRSYYTILQAIAVEIHQIEKPINDEKLADEKYLAEILEPLSQKSTEIRALGWRSLGNILRITGYLEASVKILHRSLAVAAQLSPQEESQALLSLGNSERALATEAILFEEPISKQYVRQALDHYDRAANKATSLSTQIQARLNQLSLSIEAKPDEQVGVLLSEIAEKLRRLPVSSFSVSARVNFARSLIKLKAAEQSEAIAKNLSQAIAQAQSLKDQRVESYAYGTLGNFYEESQQWFQAKTLTEKALNLAQSKRAAEIAYQWQWQLGRIYRGMGKTEASLETYLQAVETLKSLRGDLASLNTNIQYNFRDEVEPIYRQTTALLLESVDKLDPKQKQERLEQARTTIEALQLAELDNFFRDACAPEKKINLDEVVDRSEPSTAVIYAILLANRLEIIAKLPQRTLLHYTTDNLSQETVENTIENLLEALKEPSRTPQLAPLSQQLYNWLFRQTESDLSESGIKNLVFVLDGVLRNIPMAVLDDGSQYLIEKYAIALSPALKLLEPKPLNQQPLAVLAGGIYKEGAPSLRARRLPPPRLVEDELKQIQKEIPTDSLANENFTKTNLQNHLDETQSLIVHLATHGQFSSNPAKTYILTWDSSVNVKELDRFLQGRGARPSNSIELLVLSACQTATGDNRAVLGLAGVAIRSGARSTLATLWSVRDEAIATLMIQFYQTLNNNPSLTKAQALQQAQLYLLQGRANRNYQLPYYWASLVLVGNWL